MDFKVTYCGTTKYEIYLYSGFNEYRVSTGSIITNLQDAINDTKELMFYHRFMNADIVDATTGEIVATVTAQDDDHERIKERCSGCAYNVEHDGVSCCDIDGLPIFSIDHCEAMEDDNDEPDEDFEIGYNPYLGCFDFDC